MTLASSAIRNQLDYELGVLRMFGESDIGTTGLVSNWAEPEDAHVWNDGPEPTLFLQTTIPDEPCVLEIGGSPFSHGSRPLQEITAYANGFRIGSWTIRQPDALMRSIIEPEQFFKRNKKAVLKLTWHIPTSVSPAEVGAGADNRILGFVFRTLRLTPASMM